MTVRVEDVNSWKETLPSPNNDIASLTINHRGSRIGEGP
jgi:hypothetical protein